MLLLNANVVLPTHETEKTSVLIENDRIVQILSEDLAIKIKTKQVLDLDGARLFPGFIDIHNHGAVGIDVNNAGAKDLQDVGEFLAQNGVTTWLPTLVPDSDENYQKCVAAIDKLINTQEQSENAGARAIGVHYEGPFVSEKQCGALRVKYFKTFEKGDELSNLPKLKAANAAHLITLAPEISGGLELIRKLKKENWIIAIGHTRADLETLDAAMQNGVGHITHFFNAMTGLHHRDLGVVGWGLNNDQVTVDIIADGIHVAPPVLKIAHTIKTAEKLLLISDSVSPTGLGDGDFTIWNERISVVNGRTRNERGSIAGSVITLLDAVGTMLSLGIPAPQVSRMASLNPAKLLGVEKDRGSIATGQIADLTAVDNNNNVVLTIVNGRIAFSKLS